jgi:hypothetical protein
VTTLELLRALRSRLERDWAPGNSKCTYLLLEKTFDAARPRLSDSDWYRIAVPACALIMQAAGVGSLVEWNDKQTTVAPILTAVDDAITLAVANAVPS